jgi:hypothetical protein
MAATLEHIWENLRGFDRGWAGYVEVILLRQFVQLDDLIAIEGQEISPSVPTTTLVDSKGEYAVFVDDCGAPKWVLDCMGLNECELVAHYRHVYVYRLSGDPFKKWRSRNPLLKMEF